MVFGGLAFVALETAMIWWRIDAAPLWRRAEPGDDPTLVQRLADDIAGWIAACEA